MINRDVIVYHGAAALAFAAIVAAAGGLSTTSPARAIEESQFETCEAATAPTVFRSPTATATTSGRTATLCPEAPTL